MQIEADETYKSEATREGDLASVKSNAPGASLDDQS